MPRKLDQIDKKILNILQENARTPVKEIAEQVFLSSPAVTLRIQHLAWKVITPLSTSSRSV